MTKGQFIKIKLTGHLASFKNIIGLERAPEKSDELKDFVNFAHPKQAKTIGDDGHATIYGDHHTRYRIFKTCILRDSEKTGKQTIYIL